jgi:hypothetical protein
MPDYKIKCWDAESLKEIDNDFVKEAFEARRYAFVADYVRFYALKKYGGIYLDSDVEVYKSFDDLLSNSFFTGTDIKEFNGIQGPEAAIIGAEANHPFIDEFLKYYEGRHFIQEDGSQDMTVLPNIMGNILLKYGYRFEDTEQVLPNNSIIYSTDYFVNVNSVKYKKRNYAFHVNANYWVYSSRGRITYFCWKHRLMPQREFILNIFHKLQTIGSYMLKRR